MENEKEFLLSLVSKQKNCEFSLKYFLQKKTGAWKNIFTMLKLIKKATKEERKYDYGKYVLGEKLLSTKEGKEVISNCYQIDVEKKGILGKLKIPDYNDFVIISKNEGRFRYSKERYGYMREEWSMTVYKYNLEQFNVQQGELLNEGLPYYPDVNNALIHFFDIAAEQFTLRGEFWVVIPDYRARIKSMKLIFSKVDLELDSPGMRLEDLALKYFATSGFRRVTSPDIYPESKSVQITLDFQPDTLHVVLLSRQDNVKIDQKVFSKWIGEVEGVFVKRPKEEIFSLARAGESQNLEYKYDVIDEKGKDDFIETVVAFLNSNRGIILVGVTDNGEIVGTQKNREDFSKMIHDRCEPPPKAVKIQEQPIEELGKVIIVEVPKGDDPPYQSKKDKMFYVRHNGSDMRAERSEILGLLKKQEYSSYR